MGEAIDRLDQLRDSFDRAIRKLDSLPDTGLSNDGRPFLSEVADALQSFAAWFSELTFDECSMNGSAWRVLATVNGLDAIADWVGLHQSQQFAADIRADVGELVEQSETLDVAVTAAFTVKRTLGELHLSRRRRISQAKRDAIDDSIQSVATLAEHLGIRLQRIALMTRSPAEPSTPASSTPSVHDIAVSLTNDAQYVLQALLEDKATSRGDAVKKFDVGQRSGVHGKSLRVALGSLAHSTPPCIESAPGKKGGVWLTLHGVGVARAVVESESTNDPGTNRARIGHE